MFIALQLVQSQEFGVRSSESGVQSQEFGVRSSESGVQSQEFGVHSSESRVKSSESDAELPTKNAGLNNSSSNYIITFIENCTLARGNAFYMFIKLHFHGSIFGINI